MLVPFPIALWIASLASDLVYWSGVGGLVWKDIALYSMAAGVGGGLAAAVPGYLDYRGITDPLAARTAERHMILNLVLIVLFCINVLVRMSTGPEALAPVILSLIGVAGLTVSGWLGGELVYVQGIGVQGRGRHPAAGRRAA